MKIVYKIRRKSDGLFSTGGQYPSFTTKGKFWANKSGLHNHLNMNPVTYTYHPPIGPFGGNPTTTHDAYADCEIVEYEIREDEGTAISVSEYREVLREAADVKMKRTRTRIKKCPTCSQPLNTHLCGAKA